MAGQNEGMEQGAGTTASSAGAPQGYDPAQMYVWLRSLESKVNNLLRQVDVLKNDVLKKQQDLKRELKVMADDLVQSRHQQEELQRKADMIVNELRQTSGKEEVAVIRKYLDLWNPLHFVTQTDLDRAIDTALKRKAHGETHPERGHYPVEKEILPFQ